VATIRAGLPELPAAKRRRITAEWSLSEPELRDLVNADAVDLVERTVAAGAAPNDARKWWLNELSRRATEQGVELAAMPITPAQVARISALVAEGSLTDKLARQVFDGVLAGEGEPDAVVESRGLAVVTDESALVVAVDDAIAANPDIVAKVRDGKVAAVGPLVGGVMKAMAGRADAKRVRELLLERLGG
jgi:aspartyl-tRNA(Asn)/glutamyl-tRNA(Gln) amidotransferase subunit B